MGCFLYTYKITLTTDLSIAEMESEDSGIYVKLLIKYFCLLRINRNVGKNKGIFGKTKLERFTKNKPLIKECLKIIESIRKKD